MLSGNTLAAVESDEVSWVVFYDEAGIEWGRYGGDTDKGRWRIGDDMLCSDWNTWGDGERCFALYRNKAGEVLGFSDGEHEWTAKIEPGDHSNLKENGD